MPPSLNGPDQEHWDEYWSSNSCGLDDSIIHRYYRRIIWEGYLKALDGLNLKEPSVLELGCGTGYKTARILQHLGGRATLIDFSEKALDRARVLFDEVGIDDVKFVKGDIRSVDYEDEFDLVHSDGVVEHFEGDEQRRVFENHCRAINSTGYVFIFVPSPTWYYRIWKWGLTALGRWRFGYEEPMVEENVVSILEGCGMDAVRTVRAGRFLGVVVNRAPPKPFYPHSVD